MGSTGRIAVVVVTYNRKEMLLECLRAVLLQSQHIDRVFVIDNASTDGTPEYLRASGVLEDPRISYDRQVDNSGGAGGFSRGLRQAFAAGYDWIWVMDDDVEPDVDALEVALSYSAISGCICLGRRFQDGGFEPWGATFVPRTARVVPGTLYENSSIYIANVACFEGMLISRDVVAAIGFPDEEYFIARDDTIYGYRASKVTPVIYVKAAKLLKKIRRDKKYGRLLGVNVSVPAPQYQYYFIRNWFFDARRLHAEGRLCRLSFALHFSLYIVSVTIRLLAFERNLTVLRFVYSAVIDALRGRGGKCGVAP